MAGERYVALGLAPARATWFRDVARWSTGASIPVEFVKCVSVEELRTRLRSGRAFSVLLLDAGQAGVDRDLLHAAATAGCAVVVIDDGRVERDWAGLGAAAVIPSDFTPAELLDVLGQHSSMIGRGDAASLTDPGVTARATGWRGGLIAVTGPGGCGASTAAMALAQGLAADARHGGGVVLADFALDADQALLHDAGDVVPGVRELVDAHRRGRPTLQEIRDLTFELPGRGYHLLLGLRRHREWTSIRARAFEASLDGLRRAFRLVVADIEPDLEGEAECGSVDVEERNLMARSTVAAADVALVVGLPGAKGVNRLVRVVADVVARGMAPERIVVVVNRAPRGLRARAELTRAVATITAATVGGAASRVPSPVFLPDRRRVLDAVHDATAVPAPLPQVLVGAVTAVLERLPAASPSMVGASTGAPARVVPGSLGAWSDEGEETA
jgi:hypothetical protein